MKLYVPACGDRITLTKPWEFDLYLESRNMKFANALGLAKLNEKNTWMGVRDSRYNLKSARAMLPADTTLECDRVYIRTFSKSVTEVKDNFDSLSWKVIVKDKPVPNRRFWAKLSDCNTMEFKFPDMATYQERVKNLKRVQHVMET